MPRSSAIRILTDYKQFQIFILGIYSGIPLFVIYSTLAAWMKSASIDITIITSFAAARVFYSLKVFWAPFIDRFKLPVIHHLGRRKSWLCLLSALISIIMFLYSKCDPLLSITKIYVLTICLGLVSATFDVVTDAYRIDTIDTKQLSIAAANAVFGYRMGGLIAGAGAFYVAADFGWETVFTILGLIYIVGIGFIITLQESGDSADRVEYLSLGFWKTATIEPFLDFFKRDMSVLILSAVIFYKLGDAMLGVVATPFYIEMGFSLKEIATVTKVFGLTATILGTYIGGIIMHRLGNLKGLIFCGIAQSVTNLVYIYLLKQGHSTSALMITIAVENIAAGMGDAALVGYLSYLCNKRFSATQYALLSSASGLFSHTIVGFGGQILKITGWEGYFVMTTVLAIPGLLILIYLQRRLTSANA